MSIPNNLIEDSLQLLEQMLHIPALSGQEKDKTYFIEKTLVAWGLSPVRYGNNVVLTSDEKPFRPTVWLHSHTDTVAPASDWSVNPYGGKFSNGKLVGLGSNDAGASVVAQLAAFRYLCGLNLPINLVWIAGAEEENSGIGGVESLLPILPKADLVIIGEPTSNNAAIAEKGLLVIDGKVKGKAGHAARNEGINAIYMALPTIQWFRDYRFEKISPLLGPVNMNLTVCKAGDKHNSVPDLFDFTVDIRLNDCYTHEEVLNFIRSEVKAEINPRSLRLKPSATPADHRIMAVLEELNISVYGSPTLSDQALIPYPSVKIGPGDSARSHTADEFIFEDEIRQGANLYVELISKSYEQ